MTSKSGILGADRVCKSTGRIEEIDVLKGVAILFVCMIHAQPLSGTLVFELVVNRAVPIFLVLFGFTSVLWWERNSHRGWGATSILWLRSRLVRLMVPVWAAMMIFWCLQVASRNPFPLENPGAVALSFLGYMPLVGTGWFVTLILEFVALFPILMGLRRLIGAVALMLVGAAVTTLCTAHPLEIVDAVRMLLRDSAPVDVFFYYWVFAPAVLWHVAGGMLLAGLGVPWRSTTTSLAVAGAYVVGLLVYLTASDPSALRNGSTNFLDLPLTLLCLAAIAGFMRGAGPITSRLRWCGLHSWGMYLGQLLVHNLISMSRLSRWADEYGAFWTRWVMFAALAGGAVVAVKIAESVRERSGLARVEARLRGT